MFSFMDDKKHGRSEIFQSRLEDGKVSMNNKIISNVIKMENA